jgi:hypothetical protein
MINHPIPIWYFVNFSMEYLQQGTESEIEKAITLAKVKKVPKKAVKKEAAASTPE